MLVARAFFIWGSIPPITKHKPSNSSQGIFNLGLNPKHKPACSWPRHSLIGAHYNPSPNTKPKISERNSPRPNDWSHVTFWTVNKTLMFAHSRLLWLIQVFGYRWCSEIGRLTLLSSDPKRSGSPIWILFPCSFVALCVDLITVADSKAAWTLECSSHCFGSVTVTNQWPIVVALQISTYPKRLAD